jgi:hypothetical protein
MHTVPSVRDGGVMSSLVNVGNKLITTGEVDLEEETSIQQNNPALFVGSYCPGTTLKILGQNGEFNFHLKLQRG